MRLTEPVRQDISAAAHSVGFPQELAQECLNAITNGHKAPVPSFAPFSGTREAGIAQLQRTWGRHFEERVSLGTYAAEHLGWLDALHATNQSRNPAIVRGLGTLGALMAADAEMHDSTSDYHARDPERRRAAIARVQRWVRFASARRG